MDLDGIICVKTLFFIFSGHKMAASSNFMSSIEKLDGRDNFSPWQFAVKSYLEHWNMTDCGNMFEVMLNAVKDTKNQDKNYFARQAHQSCACSNACFGEVNLGQILINVFRDWINATSQSHKNINNNTFVLMLKSM